MSSHHHQFRAHRAPQQLQASSTVALRALRRSPAIHAQTPPIACRKTQQQALPAAGMQQRGVTSLHPITPRSTGHSAREAVLCFKQFFRKETTGLTWLMKETIDQGPSKCYYSLRSSLSVILHLSIFINLIIVLTSRDTFLSSQHTLISISLFRVIYAPTFFTSLKFLC